MTRQRFAPTRRSFLAGAGMAAGTLALPPSFARAQDFPASNMQVVIPTGEGGGVDRAARAFTGIWSRLLGANFEYGYFPGASGQVGYEVFVGRRQADGHNLLFGNIGPEMIMYATQNTNFTYPDDVTFIGSIDSDDSVIWVPSNSPFETLQDMIEEGQSRTITLSVSRLPHPSSLGAFALAEATGMDIRLIPYGGGNPARVAAMTGEVDGCATFLSTSLGLDDQIRFLTVFQNTNRVPGLTNEAPPASEASGHDLPAFSGNRAWAIHTSVLEEHPDRVERLEETMRAVFDEPDYREAVEATGTPWEFVEFGDREFCHQTAMDFIELAERYRANLTGD